MTEEKGPQDLSESLENTRANSQEKRGFFARMKSPGDPLAQKAGAFGPAVCCFFVLTTTYYLPPNNEKPSIDVLTLANWMPFFFFLMGAALLGGLKEQNDRILALEAEKAERQAETEQGQ